MLGDYVQARERLFDGSNSILRCPPIEFLQPRPIARRGGVRRRKLHVKVPRQRLIEAAFLLLYLLLLHTGALRHGLRRILRAVGGVATAFSPQSIPIGSRVSFSAGTGPAS